MEENEEDFAKEYLALSAQVDKVTLKLFATMVEAGKVERALDLVSRLHLEKSFDLAMTIADHQRTLVDLIQNCKDQRFDGGSDGIANEEDGNDDWSLGNTRLPISAAQKVSPESATAAGNGKRPMEEDQERAVRRKTTFA